MLTKFFSYNNSNNINNMANMYGVFLFSIGKDWINIFVGSLILESLSYGWGAILIGKLYALWCFNGEITQKFGNLQFNKEICLWVKLRFWICEYCIFPLQERDIKLRTFYSPVLGIPTYFTAVLHKALLQHMYTYICKWRHMYMCVHTFYL